MMSLLSLHYLMSESLFSTEPSGFINADVIQAVRLFFDPDHCITAANECPKYPSPIF